MKKTFIFFTLLAISNPLLANFAMFYDHECPACIEAKSYIVSEGLEVEILPISSKTNKKLTKEKDQKKLTLNSVLLHKISKKNGIYPVRTPLLFDLDTELAIIPLDTNDILNFINDNNNH